MRGNLQNLKNIGCGGCQLIHCSCFEYFYRAKCFLRNIFSWLKISNFSLFYNLCNICNVNFFFKHILFHLCGLKLSDCQQALFMARQWKDFPRKIQCIFVYFKFKTLALLKKKRIHYIFSTKLCKYTQSKDVAFRRKESSFLWYEFVYCDKFRLIAKHSAKIVFFQ